MNYWLSVCIKLGIDLWKWGQWKCANDNERRFSRNREEGEDKREKKNGFLPDTEQVKKERMHTKKCDSARRAIIAVNLVDIDFTRVNMTKIV